MYIYVYIYIFVCLDSFKEIQLGGYLPGKVGEGVPLGFAVYTLFFCGIFCLDLTNKVTI